MNNGYRVFLQNSCCKIVSGVPYELNICQLIQQLNLEDYVTMVEVQGELKVIELLYNRDVFVLASIAKGEASPVAV